MPYIRQEQREQVDWAIDTLAERIKNLTGKDDQAVCGVLNYCISKLIVEVVRRRFGSIRYWIINMISGTLKNVSDEFYRRVAQKYEDKKASENGDLDFDSLL